MAVLARLDVILGVDASRMERQLRSASEKVKGFGNKLNDVGKTLSTRVTVPLGLAGAAAFKMASDAEEAANKFNVVMGSAADDTRERLQRLTETIPLTSAEMEGMAAGIQDMLVPMGVARTQAAGMSADMVELAGDLASFNNVAPTEVLEAMQSALAGSSEPMRRFGVDTRVARLQTLALEQGIIAQGEALDNTSTALAVMAAIQADSTDAMGDAARTVESTANQVKFLFRNIKQLAIEIGEVLIPVLTPVIAKINEFVVFLIDLDKSMIALIATVGGVAAAIGPVLVAFGSLTTLAGSLGIGFAALAGPAGTIAAVTAVIGILAGTAVVLVQNWDVVKVRFALIWAAIKDAAFSAIGGILDGLERLVGFVPGVGDKVRELKASFDEFAEESMAESGRQIAALERQLVDNFVPATNIAAGALAQLGTTAETTQTQVQNAGIAIDEALNAPVEKLDLTNRTIADMGVKLGEIPETIEPLESRVGTFTEGAMSAFGTLGEKISGFGEGALNALVGFATGSSKALSNFVKTALVQIGKLIVKMLILKAISAIFGGGVGMAVGGALMGGRANGGPVTAAAPVVVGERGPEVFVPSAGGNVFNRDQLAAGMGGGGGADILEKIGPPPKAMTPREVAVDGWWRELFDQQAGRNRRREGA